MLFPRFPAGECARLMTEEGYLYLDVRTIKEFDMGHPTGAYNIPVMGMQPGGMGLKPNVRFVEVATAHFEKDAKLIVGCRSGSRSQHAAKLLLSAGFQTVVDNKAGFGGNGPDPSWLASGGDVATVAVDGRTYAALSVKKG